jgi:hypothetical protein
VKSDLELIYDSITDLVRSRMHTQEISAYVDKEWRSKRRQIEIPSLLDQLQAVFVSSSGEHAGSGFASRPNARIDAMDVLMRIDTEAGNWIDHLGHTIEPELRDNLRWLNQQAPNMTDPEQLHDLALDSRGWATWARVVTGWEVPAFRPNNTCPLCAQRGGLRIRVGDDNAQGMCVHCGEHWTPATIGLLAEHILVESDTPARQWIELDPLHVACSFCKAEPEEPCRTGLARDVTEPHDSRRALAALGALAVAS